VRDKVWLHLQKEHLIGPHRKLCPLLYRPYTITKDVGRNYFELNTPPFLGLHPVFNVDLLRPYFPPLLDTSEIVEKLTPTNLNPNCIEHASIDHIVDTQVKGTCQQRIQLYRVVKAGKLLHQGKWLTQGQIEQNFSSPDGSTQRNGDHCFLRGRTDPGGYWWPPTYSNWILLTVFSSARSFVTFCNHGLYTSSAI
jgi:hypothetical protein